MLGKKNTRRERTEEEIPLLTGKRPCTSSASYKVDRSKVLCVCHYLRTICMVPEVNITESGLPTSGRNGLRRSLVTLAFILVSLGVQNFRDEEVRGSSGR